jgi:prepilin-type N-terminal cleavage/methylation domain-containing protein
MNRRSQGFTLIELLIAFALSSFIIFSLMQSYQSLMRYIETSREMMRVNRKACLLFNLFERDVMCAMIPELAKEVTPLKDEKVLEKVRREKQEREQEQEDKQPKTEEQKKKERQKKLEKKATFFKSSIEQSMGVKTPTGRYELLKGLTFITTNCLQVYGQKRVKLVRVKYELLQDKKNSKRDKPVYKLVRKETRELENIKTVPGDFFMPTLLPVQLAGQLAVQLGLAALLDYLFYLFRLQ